MSSDAADSLEQTSMELRSASLWVKRSAEKWAKLWDTKELNSVVYLANQTAECWACMTAVYWAETRAAWSVDYSVVSKAAHLAVRMAAKWADSVQLWALLLREE